MVVVAAGIGKRYGEADVVKDVSFEVERGQIFGIVGPSGSGKTTLIRMLLGVLRPTTGDLHVLGRPPAKFRRRDRERIGYMPQQFVLFPELSVMENLHFTASIYGVSWFTRGKRMRAALDFVELWDARSRPAGLLSGGMQRRLELAATLVHNPELLVLDEPTAGSIRSCAPSSGTTSASSATEGARSSPPRSTSPNQNIATDCWC